MNRFQNACLAFFFATFPSCETMTDAMMESAMTSTVKLSASDIYEFEAEYYPGTSWSYLGNEGRFHYFDRTAHAGRNSFYLDLHTYKLPEKLLDGVIGFPYDPDSKRSESVDVEVHDTYIQIHIDGEQPAKIPFKAKGFITAEHRPNPGDISVNVAGEDVTDDVRHPRVTFGSRTVEP